MQPEKGWCNGPPDIAHSGPWRQVVCKAARVGGARLKRNGRRIWVSAKLFLVVADLAWRERQPIYDNSLVGFFFLWCCLKVISIVNDSPIVLFTCRTDFFIRLFTQFALFSTWYSLAMTSAAFLLVTSRTYLLIKEHSEEPYHHPIASSQPQTTPPADWMDSD